MGRLSPAVLCLVVANAVVFLVGKLGSGTNASLIEWFAFWYPRNEHFALWQFVTYMFMHGSVTHIFFNMFALVSFGLPLEMQWRTRRFLEFYFLCGIGAALIHATVGWLQFHFIQGHLVAAGLSPADIEAMLRANRYDGPPDPAIRDAVVSLYDIYAAPMLGASGAIYGVLVAFGLLYPNAKLAVMFVPVPIAAKYFIPGLLALDLLSGVTGFSLFGGGIAHFAHIGGALIGALLMWYWRRQMRAARFREGVF